MLSNYFSSTANKSDINIVSVNKLVPNLDNKSQYVLYYKNLQLCLSLGIKLINVHRVLNLSNLIGWRNSMILIQTRKKNAANSFEKDFFKLMSNSVCGKIMKNLTKRIKVRLVNNAKRPYKIYK